MKKKKLLLSAGGTGGHLFPAQAIAEEFSSRCEILFVAGKLSSSPYFDQKRFNYHEILAPKLDLKRPFKFTKECFKGICQSIKIINSFQPDLIVGFGSYTTFPLLVAATIKKVPFILHEQNSLPGRVIRLFSRFAKKTAISFLEAKEHLKGDVELVDFPLRFKKRGDLKEEAYRYFSLDRAKKTVLIFGGSQGANKINQLMISSLGAMAENIQFLHFTGKDEDVRQKIEKEYLQSKKTSCVKTFESRMDLALSIADLVISRSGASTVSELIEWELPALLIPFPHATENHQEKNAKHFCDIVSGGRLFLESKIEKEEFVDTILSLASELGEEKKIKIKEYKKNKKAKSFSEVIESYL